MPVKHTLIDFYHYIEFTETCWNWKGNIDKWGYGKTWVRRDISLKAHRVSYAITTGNLMAGLTLDHLCRNRKCIRPDHLEEVTIAENVNRGVVARVTCKKGHPYETYAIIENGYRRCGLCAHLQSQKTAEKQKAQRAIDRENRKGNLTKEKL